MTTDCDQARQWPGLHLWVVGCGQMGGAMLARWLEAGMAPASVTVIDPAPRGLEPSSTVRRVAAPEEAGAAPALVLLGVKPQQFADVAPPLREVLAGARPIILSMMAGVRMHTLASQFPGFPLARIMPNLPVRIGRGAIALHAPGLEPQERQAVESLLAACGLSVPLEDESRFDAVTALSGSGPAFLFRFMEALAAAGEAAGLDADMARALAQQTVTGAAALAESSGLTPAALRQQVTSPGGTTEAGLDVLDGEGALSTLLRSTVRAAAERSRHLAAAAEAAAVPLQPEHERA